MTVPASVPTKVAVCCGVGGTGKTTISAALAVSYATSGERVVVLTIDPARRLADALGVDALDNVPRRVAVPGVSGTVDALMLDRKSTWDEVIRRRATPETAERLLANRYYRAVSTRLSGSHEYMAVEKLYELVASGAYDRVVVDTPPTQHVVDFFRAPDRVRAILDRSMLSLLDTTGGSLRGVAARGALSIVNRLAGDKVLGEIREFFDLIADLSAGFRERSDTVATLLQAPDTAYWLVTDANAPERNDLLGFLEELRSRGMSFAGFLVNRVQAPPTGTFPSRQALLAAGRGVDGWADAVEAIARLPESARALADAHRRAIAELVRGAGGAPAWLVPEIPGGIRSVTGLTDVARCLPPRPPV
ncbi:MAG: ArsA-related P-loop ATPase [Myxococcota bacterium]